MAKEKGAVEAQHESQEVEARVEPLQPAAPLILISFDAWFRATGRPAHHKTGMERFAPKTVLAAQRTREAWDALFATY